MKLLSLAALAILLTACASDPAKQSSDFRGLASMDKALEMTNHKDPVQGIVSLINGSLDKKGTKINSIVKRYRDLDYTVDAISSKDVVLVASDEGDSTEYLVLLPAGFKNTTSLIAAFRATSVPAQYGDTMDIELFGPFDIKYITQSFDQDQETEVGSILALQAGVGVRNVINSALLRKKVSEVKKLFSRLEAQGYSIEEIKVEDVVFVSTDEDTKEYLAFVHGAFKNSSSVVAVFRAVVTPEKANSTNQVTVYGPFELELIPQQI